MSKLFRLKNVYPQGMWLNQYLFFKVLILYSLIFIVIVDVISNDPSPSNLCVGKCDVDKPYLKA